MTTETKLTTKQATIKIGKLLKGIDNSTAQIQKHQSVIEGSVPELQKLVGGLANQISQTPAKPVKAPAKAVEAKTTMKAPAKAKAPAKVKPKVKSPVAGRPSLKQAVQSVMIPATGPMTAADIWKTTVGQYGYWSRQSLYNALKDEKLFVRTDDDKFLLTVAGKKLKTDDKADAFVAGVAADPATAKMI